MPETVSIDGARARVYREAPCWNDRLTAAIGSFRCDDERAGSALLRQICTTLAGEGFAAVIGPMDGDTWHSYRLVTTSDGSSPFLMEPKSGPYDLVSFEQAGFVPIASYVSARQRLEPLALRNAPEGLTITPWNGRDADEMLAEVYALSSRAFAKNAFYRPLPLAAFLQIYQPVVPLIRSELVLFARDRAHELRGFIFAIPDYQEGPSPSSVIFKTYASEVSGAGRAMVDHAIQATLELGFQEAIHALMHTDNLSALRSRGLDARVFRQYALMGRMLGA